MKGKVIKFFTKKRYFNWPFLELYIAIPFFRADTHVMSQRHDRDAFEYIGMRVQLFKWSTHFRLYQPYKALQMKERSKR